jgi:hypothetical protein
MNTSQVKQRVKKLFKPLADEGRIIGMTGGNHEYRIYQSTGNDISLDMAMSLNVEDVYDIHGLCGTIKIGDIKYSFYIKHGKGGGKTQAFKMRKMKEMAGVIKNCDLYMMAHIHDILTFAIEPIFIDTIKQTFVSSSSFLDYGDYAEDADMEPGKTGSPRIRLNGNKKDIHVSI